jgi:MFS family permease
VPFLTSAYGLDRPAAAFYTSLSLFGWALGAPFMGWLSDRIRLRKLPVVACTGLNVASLAAIALVVWAGIGFLLGFGLRETRCRPVPVLR